MGPILKMLAALIVIGGIWVWVHGRSVTADVAATVPSSSLAASAGLSLGSEQGAFDQKGTIILDETQGQSGTPYLLYTEYGTNGTPAVKTKRLVFQNRDACDEAGLPCATNQPDVPVSADQEVRIVGVVKDEQVIVQDVFAI